jgi:hypothetical protein
MPKVFGPVADRVKLRQILITFIGRKPVVPTARQRGSAGSASR